MAGVCSFYKRGLLECGSSRGRTETVLLYECRDDISSHLKNCCLSRSNLKEYEVILQRAGLDHLSTEKVKKVRVCAVKSRDVINNAIAQEVYQLFGITVPIGSRKNPNSYFFLIVFFIICLAFPAPKLW